MLDQLWSRNDVFDDEHASFFGVSCDPSDEAQARVLQKFPEFRIFWDFDLSVARLYGLVQPDDSNGEDKKNIACATFVLDPNLRVLSVIPLPTPDTHAEHIIAAVSSLPRITDSGIARAPAPVLVVPRVFEPEFCRQLIALYTKLGGEDSGYMVERSGKTVGVVDYSRKRRRDCEIADEGIRKAIGARIGRRLNPENQLPSPEGEGLRLRLKPQLVDLPVD